MPLILGANSVSGYTVKNSLRFNRGSSDSLTRTLSSTGDRQKSTWSCWIKKCDFSNEQVFLGYTTAEFSIYTNGDSFRISNNDGVIFLYSTALQRDPSAWYHFVVAIDTTQATASNRIRMYVNGTELTSFSFSGYPSQNTNLKMNVSAKVMDIGSDGTSAFNGYMSELYWIDGQQLTPSSFGETDTDTGIWKPKAYTGTFGTNGFYLKFANSASLGTDSSGNGNNFTVNNLTSIDQTTDTPTNNFATLNNLAGSSQAAASTFSEGNLKIVASGTNYRPTPSTIGVSAGKWYAEFLLNAAAGDAGFGIMGNQGTANANWGGNVANNYWWYCGTGAGTAGVYSNNSLIANGGIGTMTTNDIGMIAMDLDNNRVYFGKNGTWLNSSDPANGTNPYPITAATSTELGFYFFTAGDWGGGTRGNWSTNFGSPPFTIASGNTDGAGFGNFEYAVPSGYYSLCTRNLANFG